MACAGFVSCAVDFKHVTFQFQTCFDCLWRPCGGPTACKYHRKRQWLLHILEIKEFKVTNGKFMYSDANDDGHDDDADEAHHNDDNHDGGSKIVNRA